LNCFGVHQAHAGSLNDWLAGAELMLEVGAGAAAVSLAYARAHPSHQVVALDLKSDRLGKAARIAEKEGLQNIAFIQSDLRTLHELADLNGKVDTLWVTFPDPYPKDRGEKHRLTNPEMQAIYKELLKSDGTWRFKTDNEPLFDYSLEAIEQARIFTITQQTRDLHNSDITDEVALTKTRYEERFLNMGISTKYLEATI